MKDYDGLNFLCDEDLSDSLLLCDEELLFTSPSPSPAPPRDQTRRCTSTDSSLLFQDPEEDEALHYYLSTEHQYAPPQSYAKHLRLSAGLSTARSRAIRWIIKSCARHDLSSGMAFTAANYLDRFISMNYFIDKWERWMIELLSIACLSIALKLDENVSTPSLHDFQKDQDLDHSFQPCTIRRMEMAVLNALDWRLTCVTPYSYVHLLTRRLGLPHDTTFRLIDRTAEIMTHALLETKLLEFSAFALASSALKCSVEELEGHQLNSCIFVLHRLISEEDRKEEVDRCLEIMEEMIVGQRSDCNERWVYCAGGPSSPVTVIPVQRREVLDCHVDINRCFLEFTTWPDSNPRKRRKRGDAKVEGVGRDNHHG